MILTALSGEHLLLLGPPGTAKSELSRRLSKQTGGKYFERLLTRFSVPEVHHCKTADKINIKLLQEILQRMTIFADI